ncbi:hypothetical protein [Polymorphospora lycopeni]|uniref:Uncharacterized protein n=1 Tax=Polymorphospora lycopeni TaxID=3140240 RepID=A0ABV5CLZ6_9ACTN
MSTDSGWNDYLSTDTPAVDVTPVVPTVEPAAVPEPAATIVQSELTSATSDQQWSDWHADNSASWADSAQSYVDYAQQSAAQGYFDAADSAMDTAANHASIAGANLDTSIDYQTAANTHVETAATELAPYDAGLGSATE